MAEYDFKTMVIKGQEGMVRGLWSNRNLQGARADSIFPGVPACAILPKELDGEAAGEEYLESIVERGGNAAAVRISPQEWLVGAWIERSG